ncbi:hypothetical protein K2173_016622 [Erythroxylum novogranatense]|uniref:Uncharacterized protein n=1 Tax=Erythroxylum novogranatense TaxID=1862640 RepID=A0AAV8SGP3_9ROSI|nr:hypothetical protein K2173_016622 [Erythroxylum novogranatense]
MVAINVRLIEVELSVIKGQEKFEEEDKFIGGLENRNEEFCDQMQDTLNVATSKCLSHMKVLEKTLQLEKAYYEFAKVFAKLKEPKEELVLYKRGGEVKVVSNVVMEGRDWMDVVLVVLVAGGGDGDIYGNFEEEREFSGSLDRES